MFKNFKRRIDMSLKAYLYNARRKFPFRLIHPILFKSIEDFALREGKRIRPTLLILSYVGYQKKAKRITPNLYKASVCMELLHIFMLVHDDIIDRSDLRRSKPTMHRLLEKAAKTKDKEKLGYDLAIVAGDIIYALAIDAFLSIQEDPRRKEKALKYFVKTAAFTAMGEFIDILNSLYDLKKVREKEVFLNYTLKTAHYTFECPLVIGAILAGASEKEISKLTRVGLLVGLAFQIQDDVLGIFAEEKNIGKSILTDLAESKKTILTAHAYRHLDVKQRGVLLGLFKKPKKTYRDLCAVKDILRQSQSLKYSLNKEYLLLKQSLKILKTLRMKKPYRQMIQDSLLSFFEKSQKIAQDYGIPIKI